MITVRPEDILHKTMLIRLLGGIFDNDTLLNSLYFKGGTCAAMMGCLDRFSVDLDFDTMKETDEKILRGEFHKVFESLGLAVKNESRSVLQFFVKYENNLGQRNTIKVDALKMGCLANIYKPCYLPELVRLVNCATIETMFANKLVTPFDRWKKTKSVAGRDIYDIHYFFLHGYKFIPAIIEERTGLGLSRFFKKLGDFIEKHVTDKTINEDLNPLLLPENFQKIRKVLKKEVLGFLANGEASAI